MKTPKINIQFLETIEPDQVVEINLIINRSLFTGVVPNQMKIAEVIPIFKAFDPTEPKTYRHNSLLPAFSKHFEMIMYNN